MEKKNILLLVAMMTTIHVTAQSYVTAAGVRVGLQRVGFGLTLQQRIAKTSTIEAIAQTNNTDWSLATLYEKHQKILFQKRLNIYFGVGGHYGGYHNDAGGYAFYGITGIAGTEVTFGRLNVSLDYKPAINLTRQEGKPFVFHDIGFSARYVMVKQQRKKLFEGIFGGKKKKSSSGFKIF
jgi:hypothetical protein